MDRPNTRVVAAFKRFHAGAGFARLDGKPHRRPAQNTQNRAVLIENRGSPWVAFVYPAGPWNPESARAYVQDCSHNELPPPITEQRYTLHSPAVTPLDKRNRYVILYRELISRR